MNHLTNLIYEVWQKFHNEEPLIIAAFISKIDAQDFISINTKYYTPTIYEIRYEIRTKTN